SLTKFEGETSGTDENVICDNIARVPFPGVTTRFLKTTSEDDSLHVLEDTIKAKYSIFKTFNSALPHWGIRNHLFMCVVFKLVVAVIHYKVRQRIEHVKRIE
ncbi:hypothetical protein L9F63_022507, partial [Diploptera punctata]